MTPEQIARKPSSRGLTFYLLPPLTLCNLPFLSNLMITSRSSTYNVYIASLAVFVFALSNGYTNSTNNVKLLVVTFRAFSKS